MLRNRAAESRSETANVIAEFSKLRIASSYRLQVLKTFFGAGTRICLVVCSGARQRNFDFSKTVAGMFRKICFEVQIKPMRP